ncbi:glutamate receptor ionotropic, kainate 2-like [Haliotis rubra]|uniref:glutamate receptor ionotropic, kainate 2-like n=1 Tax=Haliotis rubra TaxID=36100 RepID=UPI001EE52B25|nr:glutamate receptor ionotropic, kainate 2-like [Haliotis rubra]
MEMEVQDLTSENYDVIIIGQSREERRIFNGLRVITPPFTNTPLENMKDTPGSSLTRRITCVPTYPDLGLNEFLLLYLHDVVHDVIVVLHDDSTDVYVGELMDRQTTCGADVEVLVYSVPELTTRNQWRQTLTYVHKLLHQRGIYFLLVGTRATALNTLALVNSFDRGSDRTTNFRHLSHWLVLTDVTDLHSFLPVVDNLENVILVALPTHHRRITRSGELVDFLRSNIGTCFDVASREVKCKNDKELKEDIVGYIKKLLGDSTDALTMYTLTEVRHMARFDRVHTKDIPRSGISNKLFPNKKYKWNGVHLLVSTKPWPGFVEKTTVANKTTYSGMCIDLLHSMVDAVNFTYTIEEVEDGEWGALVNGSWTGLVRQLKDREIDIGLADIGIHASRDVVMDYIYPAFKTEVIDILYRIHNDSELSLKELTTPLQPIVLLSIALCLGIVTVLFVVVEYADVVRPKPLPLLLWKAVWYMIGSILSQGGSLRPRSCSGRMLVSSWWLFCLVFTAMYSANLTVSFCVQRKVIPFTSLEQLVHASDYTWGMFNGSINTLLFGTSDNPLYKETYNRLMEFARADPSVLSKDIESHLHKVINSKYAFISSRSTLEVMVEKAPKGVVLTTVGENIHPSGVALGVPTDSPLLPELQWVMRNIRETGIMQHWVGKYWNTTPRATTAFQLGGEPLPLRKLTRIFFITGLGLSTALVMLIVETVFQVILTMAKKKKKLHDKFYSK